MSELPTIPYSKHNISNEDINSVLEVLQSEWITQGPKVKEFEEAFADYVGSEYAVAVSSGTAALHLAALTMNIQPGDKIITTPITFAATANCVRYCSGEVVFSDIDPDTYLLDLTKVREALESSPKGEFKGIIPVDFAGRSINLELVNELANEFDLWVIEDACHSPGAYFLDSSGTKQNCGNCNFAKIGIFSFHPAKHITTGEGGMVTTNDKYIYENLIQLRTHGITKEPRKLKENHGGWYYEMHMLGYNYRLSDIQASLGLSQLKNASKRIEIRRDIASKYMSRLSLIKEINIIKSIEGHVYHLFIIEAINRDGLYNFLRSKGIYCQIHYIPLHLQPYYRNLGWGERDLPVAEKYYKHCLSIPLFPSLKNDEQDYIIDCIFQFYNE